MNQRLQHDCALMMTEHLMEMLLIPEEHRKQVFDDLYAVCKAGIEAYEAQVNRMHRRLKPTQN